MNVLVVERPSSGNRATAACSVRTRTRPARREKSDGATRRLNRLWVCKRANSTDLCSGPVAERTITLPARLCAGLGVQVVGQQLLNRRYRYRFGQVMIDACVRCPPLVLLLTPARHGQQEDLPTVVGADTSGDVVSIQPGHPDVEDDHVGLVLADEVESGNTVLGSPDVMTHKSQCRTECRGGVDVVVRNQNLQRFRYGHGCGRRFRWLIGCRVSGDWQARHKLTP